MEAKPSNLPSSFVDQPVVPGDVVVDLSSMPNQTIKLGGGLIQYIPYVGNDVLGTLVGCSRCLNFILQVGTLLYVRVVKANTDMNPELSCTDGTLLYVRVVKANTGMNPELSCTDATGKAAECGPIKDGYMFESSTGLARMLLSSTTCPVLEALGKKLSFEISVGLNGRVWVNATAPSTIILVSNAIMNSESLSLVQKLLQRVQ